jgi:hydrogenase maturation protease
VSGVGNDVEEAAVRGGVPSGNGPARVLVGGVGYRFQGDLSFGLRVSDTLEAESLPAGVEVADLGYGAIYVAQDLAAADPPWERVVLVSAAARGRAVGLYEETRSAIPGAVAAADVQARVWESGAGVIDLDNLLVIGGHFGAFPADLRVVELEPTDRHWGDGLSGRAEALVAEAVERVRRAALAPSLARP